MAARTGRLGRFAIALLASAVLGLAAAGSAGAITVSSFAVTPDSTAAGANPNVTVTSALAGGNVENLSLQLPPGLIGNPTAATLCAQSAFTAEQCPSSSVVGQVSSGVSVLGLLPVTVSGPIYDLQPVGSEPARLGLVLHALGLPLELPTDVLLQAPVTVQPDRGYGLQATLTAIPESVLGVPITLDSVSMTLDAGAANGPFTRNPTSCSPATSTLSVQGYDGSTSTAASTFTPTGCSSLAFTPSARVTLGGSGKTAQGASPTLDAVITQPPGQATIQSVTVLLPASTGASLTALRRTCQPATYAAGACTSSSQVGTGTAITPLLSAPLSGPVLLADTAVGNFPSLVVELQGAIPVTLVGTIGLSSPITNTFSNIPDVPLSSFDVRLLGGSDGLLFNQKDLCTTRNSVGLTLTGHNGATVHLTVPAKVVGCAGGKVAGKHAAKPKHKAKHRKKHKVKRKPKK